MTRYCTLSTTATRSRPRELRFVDRAMIAAGDFCGMVQSGAVWVNDAVVGLGKAFKEAQGLDMEITEKNDNDDK